MTIPIATAKARDLHSALQELQKQAIAEKRNQDAYKLIGATIAADDIVAVLALMQRTAPTTTEVIEQLTT